MEPADLIAAARNGEPGALDRLVAHCERDLESYIDRHLGARLRRRHDVADIRQEATMAAVAALGVLPAAATVDDFRRMLLRNARWILAGRGRRKDRVEGESAAPTPPSQLAVAPGDTRSGSITRADELAWMHRLVDRLDPRYAAVIELRLEGLPFAEVARRLDESEENVKKRFQRAVVALRRYAGCDDPR
jgi:RNA polymerase sigma factor (sigma-70 family)